MGELIVEDVVADVVSFLVVVSGCPLDGVNQWPMLSQVEGVRVRVSVRVRVRVEG